MQTITIMVLLGACLVALLLVLFARREAAAEREAAHRDATALRDEAKRILTDAQRREERSELRERETAADQRNVAQHMRSIEDRTTALARDEARLAQERQKFLRQQQRELAEAAGLSVDEARKKLVEKIEADAESEAAAAIRKIEKRVRDEADARTKEILAAAMQRQAAPSSSLQAVTWVSLPSDEMKGRIIGREGRNIRAFEAVTGVNVIVEEGVDAVMLSSFDIERREIAEVTLRALIDDGRIQPQRIEAAYEKAVSAGPTRSRDAAVDALERSGVGTVHAEMLDVLGRLRLRTSHGQNVLEHLVECAGLAADIATQIGADADLARRAAFLHDIGKAYTSEREGTHAAIGAEVAQQYGEDAAVVHAIAAHHDEIPMETVEDVIVQVADAISASRPGARREDADGYVERLASLEKSVLDMPGVAEVIAMAAGRELRVVVEPTKVADADVAELARTIAARIDKDPRYPGEVKVTVIRELRADAVAGRE